MTANSRVSGASQGYSRFDYGWFWLSLTFCLLSSIFFVVLQLRVEEHILMEGSPLCQPDVECLATRVKGVPESTFIMAVAAFVTNACFAVRSIWALWKLKLLRIRAEDERVFFLRRESLAPERAFVLAWSMLFVFSTLSMLANRGGWVESRPEGWSAGEGAVMQFLVPLLLIAPLFSAVVTSAGKLQEDFSDASRTEAAKRQQLRRWASSRHRRVMKLVR